MLGFWFGDLEVGLDFRVWSGAGWVSVGPQSSRPHSSLLSDFCQFCVCFIIITLHSSFESNLPLKIAYSRKKTAGIFVIFSNEITHKIYKSCVFVLIKQTEI